MFKTEFPGMEENPFELIHRPGSVFIAVKPVPHKWTTCLLEMDPYLVCSSGMQRTGNETLIIFCPQNSVIRS
jgi:hypothetical protein